MTYDDAEKYESEKIDPCVDSVEAGFAFAPHFEQTANVQENGIYFHRQREAGKAVVKVKKARCPDAAGKQNLYRKKMNFTNLSTII